MVDAGLLPKPLKLGNSLVRWRRDAVEGAIANEFKKSGK
jgi:predicted DNA-binding transcriptional regulator AlpA